VGRLPRLDGPVGSPTAEPFRVLCQERTPRQVSLDPSRWLAGVTAARATRKAAIGPRPNQFTRALMTSRTARTA